MFGQEATWHLKRLTDIATEVGSLSNSMLKHNTNIALSVALWHGNASNQMGFKSGVRRLVGCSCMVCFCPQQTCSKKRMLDA